ncbi:AAA family ATPase [Microbacterium sp. NPDC028030]|uniref:MinD/ParA family ATP-binding protein n=1 Tax=Microbacterium sp. NPDC028030 TaxID=3155124 RepID=UPI0033D5C3C4
MTPKNTIDPDDNPLGVLDEAASLDTAGIGILGGTAQVSVTLPMDDDDDLADDGVVEGEVVGDLVIDPPRVVESTKTSAPSATILSSAAPIRQKSVTGEAPAAEEPETTSSSARTKPEAPVVDDAEHEESVADESASVRSVSDESATAEPVTDETIVHATVIEEPASVETPPARQSSEKVVDAEVVEDPDPGAVVDDTENSEEAEAAARFLARANADIESEPAAPAHTRAPLEKESRHMSTPDKTKSAVSPSARAAARTEVTLTSKRLDDLGESSRESADLLTADRLLDPNRLAKPEPEGAWSHFLYAVSGRRINIGDGRRARERKALSARIAAPLAGGARFVPVLSRKGGVGKTTITALLGMALADAREDRVIAVDANPDRGTLAERIVRPHHNKSVRDLVRIHDDVKGYHDISAIVARDATRLDVLASDADPRIAEAFSDSDYRDVADVAAHYYSLVLTDTGTGIVHSVMSATLDLADQIVIVSGLSVDEARLASETLTWLETNGYAEQAREAIVVLNQSTPGAPLVRLNELQAHFATRARSVVRVPYDPQIAGGGTIVFANLLPETRIAARELAALLVEGLRAKAA